MSAEHLVRAVRWGFFAAVGLALLGAAQAQTWTERVITPFQDPLLAMPPLLNGAQMLPGDAAPYECTDPPPVAKLTLTQAIQLALCQQPQIRIAAASITRQAAQLGEARAAYLPSLNIGASSQRQITQQPESQFTLRSDRRNTSQFATLTWRLLDGGGRNASQSMAQSLLGAAMATHDAELQRIFSAVTAAYFEAQTAGASHAFRRTSEGLARQTLDISKRLESKGIGSQSQTLQARVALAKAELDRVGAEGQHETAMLALQAIISLPASQWSARGWELEDESDDSIASNAELQQGLSEWLSLAMQQHPSLRAARLEAEAARDRLRVVQSEGLPTLEFTQGHYINGRPNQGLPSARSRESVTGITLNIPLFEGFSRTYKMQAARAQVSIQEAEAARMEAQVLSEIAKAHVQAGVALRKLGYAKALLEAAQEALSSVKRKFEAGVSDVSEMLQAQASLADAQQEWVRTASEWKSARLRLLAHAGVAGLKDR
ncbi:TolC family protein [Hydrogenophaga sp.]|uniref:TolC family protein n=1 Tax=Hydrogenophaga sp. TaxID=1904254 RepID=UPI00261996E4|nr:TolC family protein [Hydrogenophaga sp.]MCW5655722.1 TolC family protein [Hydrogenophaga sp.]